MNKIYNNLSIENLKKTDWFKQFDNFQQNEILEGLKNNIDVSWYAKKEFNDEQMNEIKIGLLQGLDVSFYAKEYFDNEKMEEKFLRSLYFSNDSNFVNDSICRCYYSRKRQGDCF